MVNGMEMESDASAGMQSGLGNAASPAFTAFAKLSCLGNGLFLHWNLD